MNVRKTNRLSLLFCLLLPLTAAAQSPPPAPVEVDEARRDVFSAALWVSGTVVSRNDVRIGAETDGRITWVADVGERIAQGEAIAAVDDTDLKLELQDNRARLESLKAQQRYQQGRSATGWQPEVTIIHCPHDHIVAVTP